MKRLKKILMITSVILYILGFIVLFFNQALLPQLSAFKVCTAILLLFFGGSLCLMVSEMIFSDPLDIFGIKEDFFKEREEKIRKKNSKER